MIDLDAVEQKAREFRIVKAKATNGQWLLGAWMGRCKKHGAGNHPGVGDSKDPCEITMELAADGDYARYVSASDFTLIIGCDDEGPILSRYDAELIVQAKNTDLDVCVLALVAELRLLRAQIGMV
jgi:hypothetical protein